MLRTISSCALISLAAVNALEAAGVDPIPARESGTAVIAPAAARPPLGAVNADSENNVGRAELSAVVLKEDEQEATEGMLRSLWAGYETDTRTAQIEFVFLMFSLKSRNVAAEQFANELAELNLTPDEDLARRLVEQFCPEKLEGPPEKGREQLRAMHEVRTFSLRGHDRRCSGGQQEHILNEDLHLIVEPQNHAVKAFRRGGCPYWSPTMNWFRSIPPAAILDANTAVRRDGRSLHLVEERLQGSNRTGLTVDSADGLPRRWELVSAGDGQLRKLELYREYAVYPGEVLLPAVRVEASLQDEFVRTVMMTVVREARFNLNLDDATFQLSVPAGWKWFDSQREKLEGGYWKKPVSNVAAFFAGRAASPAVLQGGGTSIPDTWGWRSLLLIVNGMLLVVVGIALWRRSA